MAVRQGIADYEFIRSLGTGSYGEFFLARTPTRLPVEDEFVAVKVHLSTTNEETYRRAVRELRTFAGVRSNYLVRLYEAGQEDERLYYASEYHPLGSLASPARPVGPSEVLRAIADTARAAHDLHEAGIAHRAIKPSNVLLTAEGGRLADLGLAQTMNPGQTATGVGSLSAVEFLDPAIVRGDNATRASDIYALGTTLHRALTGTGVFGELPDRDPLLALRKVLADEPTISDLLDPDAAEVVRVCIAADPAERPATAAIVADLVAGLIPGSGR